MRGGPALGIIALIAVAIGVAAVSSNMHPGGELPINERPDPSTETKPTPPASAGGVVGAGRTVGAGWRAGLSDAVAGRVQPTPGLDAECIGRLDLVQHGDRAHQQRLRRCVCVGPYATDPGHLQLFRAVGFGAGP